jgi:hypothetical protein
LFQHGLGPSNFSWETALWETFWFMLLAGFPAVVILRFWYVPQAYLAARVGTGICVLGFVELMLGTWMERSLQGRGFDLGRLVEAGGLTGMYGLALLACLAGYAGTRPWRWFGVAATCAGWVIASLHILMRSGGNTAGEVALVLLTTAGVAVGYANILLLLRLKPEHEWVRTATLSAFLIAAALLDINLLGDIMHFGPYLWEAWYAGRLLMATGILAACGTLAIMVLTQFHRIQQVEKAHGDFAFTTLAVVCPACKELQTLAVGESTCTSCGLRFFIRLGRAAGFADGLPPRDWNLPASLPDAPSAQDTGMADERITGKPLSS